MKMRSCLLLGVSLLFYFLLVRLQILLILFLSAAIVMADKIRILRERNLFSLFVILLIITGFFLFKTDTSMPMLFGYSVFAFSGISFLVDQYKKREEYSAVDALVYLFFFPKIMAGPIVRASDFIPQLALKYSRQDLAWYKGIKLILFGCFLKFIVADNLLDTGIGQAGINLLVQSLTWGVRFYIDFYSYSIIAVGIALWCGINLPYNFDNPYSAKSFRDFWRRWNITLSSWLRDYIYIPLGGSRLSKTRTFVNIFLTFVVSGLWHGMSIPFILWSCCHGFIVSAEKLVRLPRKRVPLPFRVMYRFFIVVTTTLLWQFFRFKDFGETYIYVKRLFQSEMFEAYTIVPLLIAAAFLLFMENTGVRTLIFDMGTSRTHVVCEVTLCALMLALLLLCPYAYSFNFFYFNF